MKNMENKTTYNEGDTFTAPKTGILTTDRKTLYTVEKISSFEEAISDSESGFVEIYSKGEIYRHPNFGLLTRYSGVENIRISDIKRFWEVTENPIAEESYTKGYQDGLKKMAEELKQHEAFTYENEPGTISYAIYEGYEKYGGLIGGFSEVYDLVEKTIDQTLNRLLEEK